MEDVIGAQSRDTTRRTGGRRGDSGNAGGPDGTAANPSVVTVGDVGALSGLADDPIGMSECC